LFDSHEIPLIYIGFLAGVHASQLTAYSVSHHFIVCNLIDSMVNFWLVEGESIFSEHNHYERVQLPETPAPDELSGADGPLSYGRIRAPWSRFQSQKIGRRSE